MNRSLLIVAAFLLSAIAGRAQSVDFINMPDNAQRMSLGGADVSYDVARLQEIGCHGSAEASYVIWEPDGLLKGGNSRYMVDGYARLGEKLAISAKGKFNNFQRVVSVDGNGNPGKSFTPSEYMAGIGLHFRPVGDISILARANLISSNLAVNFAGQTVATDIGVAYDRNDLSIALIVRNLGPRLEYAETVKEALPMVVLLGAEKFFGFGRHRLGIVADAGYMPLQSCAVAKAGVRFSLFNAVDIMAGGHYGSDSLIEPGYGTVGIGFNVSYFNLCSAYIIAGKDSPLRNTLAFSLGVRF